MNAFNGSEPTKKLLKILLFEIIWIILDIHSELLRFALPLNPRVLLLLLSRRLALVEPDIEQ